MTTENFQPNLKVDYINGDINLGVDFRLTDEDLALPIDEFCERLLKPAFAALLDNIARKRGLPTSLDKFMAEAKVLFPNALAELEKSNN